MQPVGRQRFSRLCVLMNPCPAGRAIHPDRAGEMLENTTLAVRTVPGRDKSKLDNQRPGFQAGTPQLTNRRIRTFIAAPSARNVNNTEDPP
jgi:hypothetical protein